MSINISTTAINMIECLFVEKQTKTDFSIKKNSPVTKLLFVLFVTVCKK